MVEVQNSIVVRFQTMKRKLQDKIEYNQLDETTKAWAESFLERYADKNLRSGKINLPTYIGQ